MKRTLLIFLLALALPALAADNFPINVYPCPPCPKIDGGLTLDGKLGDPAWKGAPVVSGFTIFGTDKLADPQTSFQLVWDERNLYLGVCCDEPNIGKLSPIKYAHDEHAVFSNETIEFFIDPNHTHAVYYQLAFNVAGSLYDGEGEATVWNSDATVKTFVGDTFWSVEIAVPWGPLKAKPAPGKVIGFNVNRDRNVGDKLWMTWAKVQGGFHDPQRFAHLVLSGTPEMIGQLSAEFRNGDRTGAIVVYSNEGFAQTTYASLAKAAFAEVDKLLADLEAQRQKESDPGASAEIKRRLDEYQAKLTALQQQNTERLNAAEWMRLDLELQGITSALSKTVWEARLTALLGSI